MKYVSAYTFSVDNFNRSREEVTYLMDLASSKFVELGKHNGFLVSVLLEYNPTGWSVSGAARYLCKVLGRFVSTANRHSSEMYTIGREDQEVSCKG